MSQVCFFLEHSSTHNLGWFVTLEMLAKFLPLSGHQSNPSGPGETQATWLAKVALASKLACPAQMLKSGIKLKSPLVWHGCGMAWVCPRDVRASDRRSEVGGFQWFGKNGGKITCFLYMEYIGGEITYNPLILTNL